MFRNYFKVAYRNLLHNKLYTFVNILGMGVAIAFCILAYLNHTYNYTFDAFHQKADHIFQVKTARLFNNQEQPWGFSPRPLGPALVADFPAVKRAVRLTRITAALKYGDNIFNESVLHTEPGFFEMFDFPLKYGTPDVLQDKRTLVLSEELAEKYFGDENPVGRQVTLRYRDEQPTAFIIGAVAGQVPDNSSIKFDVLASLDVLVDVGIDKPDDWADWAHATFVEIADPTQIRTIQNQLEPYVAAHNAVAPDWQITSIYFDPLRDLALNAWKEDLNGNILKLAMHPAGVISPSIIALLLLFMACFNYINTSIAFSSRRLKEIGVRKVIGGLRRQLIAQFLLENVFLCACALALGMVLAEIFVPIYDDMWRYFELDLVYAQNLGLLAFLAGLMLFIGIAAGSYPAVYISRYNPVKILRGQQRFGRSSLLARALLTFQFTVSMLTLISSLVFIQNADFLKNIDLGYNQDQVVVVPLGEAKNFEPYRNAVKRNIDIVGVSGSQDQVGFRWRTQIAEHAEQQSRADVMAIGPDYLETMSLSLVAGRGFEENLATDVQQSIVINQRFAQEFGWTEPLGQTLTIDSTRYSVVGVVQDFYNIGVWRPIRPIVFRLAEQEDFRYLVVRLNPSNLAAGSSFLRSEWQRLFPDLPYEGFYEDEVMAEAISVTESAKTMFLYISFLAIVIAAMGLFALVSLSIARRTKEIGIRKVLGASVMHVMSLVNREFFGLLLVAAVIASVAGYYAVQALLRSIYSYHVGFSTLPFIVASLCIFAIAIVTVGSQVLKVVAANPVKSLRYE